MTSARSRRAASGPAASTSTSSSRRHREAAEPPGGAAGRRDPDGRSPATRRGSPMKLGMVGLGRMGGNMAERLRAHGHEVVGFDTSSETRDVSTPGGVRRGPRRPPDPVGDGPRRRSHGAHGRGPLVLARARRRRDRGRQLELAGQRAAGGPAGGAGHRVHRRGDERRGVGAHRGLLPHGGRRGRARGLRPAGVRRAGARGRVRAHGRRRHRPLHEDGPQRDRVRPHAGVRGGLRAAGALGPRDRCEGRAERLAAGERGAVVAPRPAGARASTSAPASTGWRRWRRTRGRVAGPCRRRSSAAWPRR